MKYPENAEFGKIPSKEMQEAYLAFLEKFPNDISCRDAFFHGWRFALEIALKRITESRQQAETVK